MLFDGIHLNMGNLILLSSAKTRSICPENPTGEKGEGAKSKPEIGSAAQGLGEGWKTRPFITIQAEKEEVLADIQGSGAIQSFWISGEVDKGLILRMYWDEQDIPSVECPLTDFFLYGWAKPHSTETWNQGPVYKVNSMMMCVNPNRGLNCFIVMPFKKKCKITLENRSSKNKVIYYQISYTLTQVPEEIGYFHAQYRRTCPVKYKAVHTILDDVKGKGHYIGTVLYVGLNRTPRWWGEGEIKFYMDGDEEYPTICGTGLEDYFGGAFNWDVEGEYQTYSTPFMGMPHIFRPDGTYNIQQRYVLYRWHVMDPIRFEENLKVTIQDLGWDVDDEGVWKNYLPREDDMISVAYWYQTLPTQTFPQLPSHQEITRD